MQSVLSVQAARASKATEKREMEGKVFCKAGQSKCNIALEILGGNPHLGASPGWKQEASPSLTSCQLQWQSSWSKGSSLLCLPTLQRSLTSYSYCTLIFHMKSIYIKLLSTRRKIFTSYTPSRPSTRDSLPWQHFEKPELFFLMAVALKHGINESSSLVLCLFYFQKTKPQQGDDCEISYNLQ